MRSAIVASLIMASACAHNVPQDHATGADGKQRGARPLVLEDGEARIKDVVTYPGGDRVDWKRIDLPAGKRGTLDLRMSYSTPRPGLRVTIDVFDQWNTRLWGGGSARAPRHTIPDAAGTYFVRIHAPRRTDAGTYRLAAAFVEEPPPPIFKPLGLVVSEPPRLPAIPDPPSTCEVFSARDPACQTACPPGAPPTWVGCAPPAAAPVAPVTPVTPVTAATPTAAPVTARVLAYEVQGDGLLVTIGAGSADGVTKAWKASLLRGDSGAPLPGGSATMIRIDKRRTIIKVRVTPDQLRDNQAVLLAP